MKLGGMKQERDAEKRRADELQARLAQYEDGTWPSRPHGSLSFPEALRTAAASHDEQSGWETTTSVDVRRLADAIELAPSPDPNVRYVTREQVWEFCQSASPAECECFFLATGVPREWTTEPPPEEGESDANFRPGS
jgi:hypothetical protein